MNTISPQETADDEARRAYWRQQMEAAYQWMTAIRTYPVSECGEPLVSLEQAVKDAMPAVRVMFSTRKHVNQCDRLFFLRSGLIVPFLAAAREMNGRGWILKVEDAYRTREMQTHLTRVPYIFDKILAKTMWECRAEAVPLELLERRAAVLVANLPKVGTHMSASAMDISVFEADGQTEVDRGSPYLELSELTPMETPFVPDKARENRRTVTGIMASHGFVAYPFEFWHYSQGDAYEEYVRGTGRPGRYGAVQWDPQTHALRPYADPLQPLNSLVDIRAEIARALDGYERKQ